MMDDKEFFALMAKIKKEFPVRIKLAKLADVPHKNLIDFDHTVADLFLKISLEFPDKVEEALKIIKTLQ